ncbi:MAG: AAA family ATPase [Chloroflexi bacterium]|nr:AAA family ATPase [Chloroflexota bacterium]
MIVEFIGVTGAGKTTLINALRSRLEKTSRVTTSVDLATSLLGFKNVTNLTLQNLEQELISLPIFIGTLSKYHEYLRHTIKLYWRNSGVSMQTIHNLRSLERKIGMYEITKYYGCDQIMLVDEGPILALHMFVSAKNTCTLEEIARFTDLLPLPDLVIYIRASVETLIERTVRRADPPREVDLKNPAQMDAYFKNAVSMFDQLSQARNIRDRILVVESHDIAGPGFDQVGDHVQQAILSRATFLPNKPL